MKGVLVVLVSMIFTACSLSMQNIDTHGRSSHLVADNQTDDPTITPTFNGMKK